MVGVAAINTEIVAICSQIATCKNLFEYCETFFFNFATDQI